MSWNEHSIIKIFTPLFACILTLIFSFVEQGIGNFTDLKMPIRGCKVRAKDIGEFTLASILDYYILNELCMIS